MSHLKRYIGDAVYADVDEFGRIVLTTEDGIVASNRIVLEAEVLTNLQRFVDMLKEQKD